MSTARERILGKISSALESDRDEGWRSAPRQRLEQPPRLIRPGLPEDLTARFAEKLQVGGGTFEHLGGEREVPAALGRFLETSALPPRVRASPELGGTPWGDHLEVSYGSTHGDDLVSVTPAFLGVAETGSVVVLSGESGPTTLNFLPDVHVVVLAKSQIVSHIDDVWVRLRALGEVPRTVNFITGPSKTADVEQTLQIGAHGPRRLHVMIVDR